MPILVNKSLLRLTDFSFERSGKDDL
jgi:hypothetical protein